MNQQRLPAGSGNQGRDQFVRRQWLAVCQMVRAIMELDDFRAVAAAPAVGLDEQVRPGKLGSTVLRVLDPAVGDREHDRHRPYAGPGAGAEKAQLVAEPVLFVAVGAQQLIEGALGLHAPQIFV
ncbi:MAG TPA: hypothetical protein VGJ75_11360, partial [Dongiaceae bacterium]